MITSDIIILGNLLSRNIKPDHFVEGVILRNYFELITSNLNFDDLSILTFLSERGADIKVKAISKNEIKDIAIEAGTPLTEAALRKSLYRLEALMFIKICAGARSHKVMLTDYGYEALRYQLEGERV